MQHTKHQVELFEIHCFTMFITALCYFSYYATNYPVKLHIISSCLFSYDVILYQAAPAVCYLYVCAIHKQNWHENPVYSPTGIVLAVKRSIDFNAIIAAAHHSVAKTDLKTEQENV